MIKKLKYWKIALSLFKNISNWYEIPLLVLGYKKVVKLSNGTKFLIYDYLNILQLVEIFYKNDYKVSLSNPKVIIDIGANIGDSTVYFAQKYSKAKVYAFEPDKKIFQIMLKNIAMNNIKNVTPFNLGVSNSNGKKEFYSYEFSGLSGFSKIDRIAKKTVIKVISLQKVFSDNKILKCDLIKMDCEGAEYEILLNSKAEILKRVKEYAVEYHDGLNKYSHPELINLFKGLRYKIKVHPHGIEKNIGIIKASKR